MSISTRLWTLARTAVLAAALAPPVMLAGCAQPLDDGTYYLGQNAHVPAALCAASAAC